MGNLGQDLSFAVRVLKKRSGVTVTAILVLALGIGGNTAIFSLVNGILLKPLSLPEPERVVQLERWFPEEQAAFVSAPKFHYWRENSRSFEAMAGWDNLGSGFNLTGDGRPERIIGSRVTADFFTVFRSPPVLGRDFLPSDDRPGAQGVVILSHRLWQRRFGGDAGIIGSSLSFDGIPRVVIGVAPASFRIPENAELWIPWQLDPAEHTDEANILFVSGRLRPGVTLEEARAEMRVVGRRFLETDAAAQPDSPEQVVVTPMQEFLYGDLRPALAIMLAAVGLVLLIACANVANLQLARSTSRKKEIALRAALGAPTARIFRQLLTESIVLSIAGGACGLLLCSVMLRPLLAFSPMHVPRLEELGIDGGVLLFTLVLSMLTGVLFGVAPALYACRIDFTDAIRDGSLRTTVGAPGGRTRLGLVISQVALAVMLMIGAALLLRSFLVLRNTDPGLDPERVLTLKMSLGDEYTTPSALGLLGRRLISEISALPGVAHVALSTSLPFELGPEMPFTIAGRDPESRDGIGQARYVAVAGKYFQALNVPLKDGRLLRASDQEGTELVVLVNETAARSFWPGEEALEQRIHLGLPHVPAMADPAPRRIVGIVADVRELGLDQETGPVVYVPLEQMAPGLTEILVRSLPINLAVNAELPPAQLAPAIREKVWAVAPHQPVSDVLRMEEIIARSLGSREFNMLLLSLLAAVAMMLAAVGIYGVLAYLVSQRTREIGIRMALGAGRGEITHLVVRQSMTAVVSGIAIGVLGAVATTRFLASMLSGISSVDWMSFLVVPVLFALVALVATIIPARRAARVDPTAALKWE